MKKVLLLINALLLTSLLALGATSTGVAASANSAVSGGHTKNFVKEVRNVNHFTAVHASAGIKVYIIQSSIIGVTVEATENVLSRIKTVVKGNVLHVSYDGRKMPDDRGVVYVSMPIATEIKATSAAEVKVKGELSGSNITILASSSAEVEGNIEYRNVKITASSSAEIELKGNAENCMVTASSSADVDLEKLVCTKALVKASSAAEVDVYVTTSFSGDASSAAEITYYGDPSEVETDRSSAGSVKKGYRD